MWYLKDNIGSIHSSYHFLWGLSEKQQQQQQQQSQVVVVQQVSARAVTIRKAWQSIRR
jgi:hypothetical protein